MTRNLFITIALLSAAGATGLLTGAPPWARATAVACLFLAAAIGMFGISGRSWPAPRAVYLTGHLPGRATFRNREAELAKLHERLDHLRGSPRAHGAVIIAIHGMPGVGKSALAQEFARQVADDFPDGMLYANLGNAGRMRAESDILARFLTALRPDEPVPGSTLERAARFRSLTARAKVLIVLDAARDHDQVARLLPGGGRCAVVLTSRRNLGPALGIDSYQLGVPDTDSALEMLHVLSLTPNDEDQKFALEIVDRLGRLPMALRALGDAIVEEAGSLLPAARRLRKPDPLGVQGRFVRDRIESEYGRLTEDESRAFRMASVIKTPSFVPWILAPLLDNDAVEVEKLVCRLAERQLLEHAGVDETTGLDRYRFHPVVRDFAEELRFAHGDDDEAGLRRVDEAYLEAIDLILTKDDPGYAQEDQPLIPRRYLPTDSDLPYVVAGLYDRWVRAEYHNLLRCVKAAHNAGRYAMCWRIAARLGDCVPRDVDRQSILDGLDLGLDAASKCDDQSAVMQVLLARGGFLGRLGGYTNGEPQDGVGGRAQGVAESFDALAEAAHLANRLRSAPPAVVRPPRQRIGMAWKLDTSSPWALESESYRRLGEAHLRAGAYRDADRELRKAQRLAEKAGDKDLITLMRVSALGGVTETQHPDTNNQDDEIAFWHGWASAELHRRARRWPDASKTLHRLHDRFEDDASRASAILLRLADIRLDQIHHDPRNEPGRSRMRAIHRAAEAVYRFQQMHDVAGTVRARCAYARALLTEDRVDRAEEQARFALEATLTLEPLLVHDLSPMLAVLTLVEGELSTRQGDRTSGRAKLVSAARLFRMHGDRAGVANALVAAGLKDIPADRFPGEPLGRQVTTWLEGAGDKLRAGQPFQLCYSIGRPDLGAQLPPAGGRYIDVLLVAEHADVEPCVRTARLDAWAPLEPLRFEVTPRREGPLRMEFLAYSADDGSLLGKCPLDEYAVVASGRGPAA